jgi:two-component system, NtrC family, sensor kinase
MWDGVHASESSTVTAEIRRNFVDLGDLGPLSFRFVRDLLFERSDPIMPLRRLMLPARLEALLLDVSTSPSIDDGALEESERIALKAVVDGLRVARAGVWMFEADRQAIRCRKLVDSIHPDEGEEITLDRATYPRYFAALDTERAVVADDARSDPKTSEFTEGYLKPLGITAMLDVPIRQHGRMMGIICAEHVGPARAWSSEEAAFAAAVADLLGRSVTAYRARLKAQKFTTSALDHSHRILAETTAADADLAEMTAELGRLRSTAGTDSAGSIDALAGIADRLRAHVEAAQRGAVGLESAVNTFRDVPKR